MQKTLREKDQGFTLIELLIVMIIIGILAAIAIPLFLSQQVKARDTSAKADGNTIAKEVTSFYVDGTGALAATATAGGTWTIGTTTGQMSKGNSAVIKATDAANYCISVGTSDSGHFWKYLASGLQTTMASAACATAAG